MNVGRFYSLYRVPKHVPHTRTWCGRFPNSKVESVRPTLLLLYFTHIPPIYFYCLFIMYPNLQTFYTVSPHVGALCRFHVIHLCLLPSTPTTKKHLPSSSSDIGVPRTRTPNGNEYSVHVPDTFYSEVFQHDINTPKVVLKISWFEQKVGSRRPHVNTHTDTVVHYQHPSLRFSFRISKRVYMGVDTNFSDTNCLFFCFIIK